MTLTPSAAAEALLPAYHSRRCLNFWACRYQRDSLYFWVVMAALTAYGVFAGLMGGPTMLSKAYNPFVYKDRCDLLSYDGRVALLHPHSIFTVANFTVPVIVRSYGDLHKSIDGTVGCFVRRTGPQLTDVKVTFNRPGLALAAWLLATSLPCLAFVVTWLLVTLVTRGGREEEKKFVGSLGSTALVITALLVMLGVQIPALHLWSVTTSFRPNVCEVAWCTSETVGILRPTAPAYDLQEAVQLPKCADFRGKMVQCFVGVDNKNWHLTTFRPGAALSIAVLVLSVLVATGFLAWASVLAFRSIMRKCDAIDRADREAHQAAQAVTDQQVREAIEEEPHVLH